MNDEITEAHRERLDYIDIASSRSKLSQSLERWILGHDEGHDRIVGRGDEEKVSAVMGFGRPAGVAEWGPGVTAARGQSDF